MRINLKLTLSFITVQMNKFLKKLKIRLRLRYVFILLYLLLSTFTVGPVFAGNCTTPSGAVVQVDNASCTGFCTSLTSGPCAGFVACSGGSVYENYCRPIANSYNTPYGAPYATPGGGYATPYGAPYGAPYGTPYGTPYSTPYNTPYTYPAPADFTPTSFYLKDSTGAKTYNFDFNEDIYWYAQIKNIGELSPNGQYGVNVYSNLYQDHTAGFGSADTTRTPSYIKHPNGDFTSGTTLTFDSRATGTNTGDFVNANSFSYTTGDGKPLDARIFVDPLNQYPDEATNYGNNQATFRYTVGPPADLIISNFHLLDGNGKTTTSFALGQNIFPYVQIKNNGGSTAISTDTTDENTYTWTYRDEPANLVHNTVGDTDVEIKSGEFDAGVTQTYWCKADPGNRCGNYINQEAWDTNTKGTYTARVFTNFDHNVLEGNYANNQATIVYSVGYAMSGRIYADMDASKSYNAGDFPLSGIKVTFTGPNDSGTATTDTNGNYTSPALEPGTYTVTTNVSDSYTPTITYPRVITFDSRADLPNQNIRYFPKYSIDGNAFVDNNSDFSKNNGEINFAASPKITVTNLPANTPTPIITNNPDGSYVITGLINARYRVNYTGLPAGYIINNPEPPYFDATVGMGGNGCAATPNAPDASCTNGSLNNLNFAIKGGQPWWQSYGLDVRLDSGISDPIPPNPDAACGGGYASVPTSTATDGVMFSGSTTPYFWKGGASNSNWIVGDSSYHEQYPINGLKTSYAYMQGVLQQSNITPINTSTVCPDLTNCTLPGTLANGVYQANSSLTLNGFTFPANKNYVFLVNGDLTIRGNIHVPTTSTATLFASNDIKVSANLGSVAACPAPVAGAGDLEGFYSADHSVRIFGSANCAATPAVPDKQLNIQGSLVINAAQGGGTFTNDRDLCTDNVNFPSVTFKERPDMILNSPDLIHSATSNFREVAP
ncbi:hypothetical protein BH09PAT1_BH09PAT1_5630 [soil metagenome]